LAQATMSRCRECLYRLTLYDEPSTELLARSENAALESDSSSSDQAPAQANANDEEQGLRFEVTVDGFQIGNPVMYNMTIRRGDAVWRIRRRFGNVLAVHASLLLGCGRSALKNGLPRPPNRVSPRSLIFGQRDPIFLERRGRQIEQYMQRLLGFIPCVEQCEALYMFLCYVNLPRWEGDGTMVGGGAPPVDDKAVAKLPKAVDDVDVLSSPAQLCVICQEALDIYDQNADVRVLPCGHQFHFGCISSWLKQRNTCCVCNGAAVLTAPRFLQHHDG